MNTRWSKTKRGLFMLLTAGMLWAGLGLSEALAADEKRFPGTYCKPGYSSRHYFGVGSGISVYNKSSTQWLYVYCPIIRDEMTWSDKLKWVNVDYINPYHKDRQIVCWVQSRDPRDGRYIKSVYNSENPTYPNGKGSIGFSWDHYSWHYFYMVGCALPPSGDLTQAGTKVQLSGYWVRED